MSDGDHLLNSLFAHRSVWCLSTLTFVLAASVVAQPDNDKFANRSPLVGSDVRVQGTFLDASREPGEDSANGAGVGEVSVWWSWRAPRDGPIRVSVSQVSGSVVRRLMVFEGNTLSSLSLITSAEAPAGRLEAQVVVPVQGSRTYVIAAIDGDCCDGFFNLRLVELPPGDVVATPLEGEAFDLEGTTVNATPEPGLPGDAGQAPTVSWEWTAPGDGAVWIIAGDPDDDAIRVHVFRFNLINELTEVSAAIAAPRGQGFGVSGGSRYRLMFTTDPGSERPFHWQMTFSRMHLTGVTPGQALPGAAPLAVQLEDLPTGVQLRELVLVDSYFGNLATNNPGQIQFTWQPRASGWDLLSAYAEDALGRLWLTPQINVFFNPINDNFAYATTLSGAGFSQSIYLAGAATEPGEPEPDRPSVWYRWTAVSDGAARVALTWSGGVTNLGLRIYRGVSLDMLELVASGEATNRSTPVLFFPVSAGVAYTFAVKTGTNGPWGALLTLLNGPIPINDRFVDRQGLAGTEPGIEASLLLATAEPGERGVFDGIAYRSLWYAWTPPTDGEWHGRATGPRGARPGVSVFTGTAVNALRPWPVIRPSVIEGWNLGELWALVRATTNYNLALDTYPYAPTLIPGNFALTFDFTAAPPNDAFDQRLPLSGNTVAIRGTLVAARGEDSGPSTVRATPLSQISPTGRRAVWYEWTASQPGKASLTVLRPAAVSAAIFTGASLGTLVPVSASSGPGQPATFNVAPGVRYLFAFVQSDAVAGTDFAAYLAMLGPPQNDHFAARILLTGSRTNFIGINYGASLEPGEPLATTNSTWWRWTAPAPGWATLRSPRDIAFAVFNGDALDAVQTVPTEAHPVSSPLPGLAVTGFECQAAVTYQIAASRLSNTNPSAYEVALDLTSLSFRSPTNGIAVRAGSVLTLEMAPIDETLDGLLPERLTLAHDPGGSFGSVAFSAGQPPRFALTNDYALGKLICYAIATNQAGERRASRPLTIFVRSSNDNFADALAMEDLHSGDFIYFSGATLEPDESDYGGAAGTGSRWWRWTAPATGDAELTLRNYDGVTIYTGATLKSLAPIPVERVDNGGQIAWRFATQRGVTYQVALFGTQWPAIFERFSWSPVRFPGLAREQVLFIDERVEVVVDLPATDVQRVELYADSDRIGAAYAPPFVVRSAALPWNYSTDNLRALVVKSDGSSSWSSLPYRVRWRVRNDDFAGRTIISGEAVAVDAKSFNATREPGEPDHGAPALTRTLWWTWTAPGDGILQVRAAGTRTAVYRGAALDTLSLIEAADQGIRISVQSGANYQIALATSWDAAYLRLNYSPPPPDAPVIITGESADLILEFGALPGTPGPLQSREFLWTAPGNGVLALSTDEASAPSPLLFQNNAQMGLMGSVPNRAFAYRVEAGATYTIRFLEGVDEVTHYTWHLTYAPMANNDLFINPTVLPSEAKDWPLPFSGTSLEPGELALLGNGTGSFIGSLWFLWTAPRSGPVQATTRAYTTPFVFVGSTLDTVKPVAVSQVGSAMFDAEAGLTYRIAAAELFVPPPPFPPFPPPPFDFLTLQYAPTPSRPANDDFAAADLLTGAPVTFTGDSRFATREFREPLHAGFYGGRSVWWQWTAARSGRVQLITAPRTDRAYEIAVYRGDSLAALTPVAARTFSAYGGNLEFNASSGAAYRIVLDGTYGTEVQVDFELSEIGPVDAPQIIHFGRGADDTIQIHLRGTAGAAFTLEGSIELQNWSEDQRGTLDFRGEQLVRIPVPAADHKFFRIRTE